MSKTSLEAVLDKLDKVSVKKYREEVANKQVNRIYISPDNILAEIQAEVLFSNPTKKGFIDKRINKELETIANKGYAILLKDLQAFITRNKTDFELSYEQNGVVITYSINANNFSSLRKITSGAVSFLRNRVVAETKKVGGTRDTRNLLDLGHIDAVYQQQAANYIADAVKISPQLKSILTTSSLAELKTILSLSSEFSGDDKNFTVSLILESKGENRSKKENKEAKKVREAIRSFINNYDWANQASSDSKISQIEKQLIEEALRSGAKGKKLGSVKKSPARTKKETSIKSKPGKATALKLELGQIKIETQRSYINLIPLLNAKLPPAVRANMSEASLVNRTGRFSESVRIMSITNTTEGFPRLNYTYQRSPYDVFDPVLGARPWNTPSRDPKKLIEKSIRDIAKDLATGRFYVGRV